MYGGAIMKKLLPLLLIPILIPICAFCELTTPLPIMPPDLVPAIVDHVVDGDTAWFLIDGVNTKVRLIGIDTPETVHPTKDIEFYGKEASDFTKAALPEGAEVWLEYDTELKDKYDRDLCYVWLQNGTMLNYTLVLEGYAQVYTFPPNVKYVDMFVDAQRVARENGLGLWSSELREESK
jgi:micrococcal nuclease